MPLPSVNNIIINRTSSKDIVYAHLKQWIIEGVLMPGEKINDSEIAALFSVSRTPVREVLLRLESQQLVDITPSRGTTVSHFDMTKIKILYEAITSIHVSVLEIAYPKINEGVIDTLKSINKKILACISSDNLESIKAIDNEFHQVFFDLADNYYLNAFHNQLNIHAVRVENIYFRTEKRGEDSYHTHEKIISYLMKKNLQKAKKELASNWLHTLDLEIRNPVKN